MRRLASLVVLLCALTVQAAEGDTFERTLEPTFKAGAVARALQGKWFRNVADFYGSNLRIMGDGLYICFFLAAFFFRFVRREVHLFRWCAALGILGHRRRRPASL